MESPKAESVIATQSTDGMSFQGDSILLRIESFLKNQAHPVSAGKLAIAFDVSIDAMRVYLKHLQKENKAIQLVNTRKWVAFYA